MDLQKDPARFVNTTNWEWMPLLPWILNIAYLLLLAAVSPIIVYRQIVHGKYRAGWPEKLFGRLPRRVDPSRECVWLHAVSVGEVLQLRTLIDELKEKCPEIEIVVTTTTSTGFAVAKEKFPEHLVCYFPLDFSWAVKRALDRIRPSAVVLVELELWPNFILAASRKDIPLVLANGRISENSFRGYRRIKPLMRNLLRRFCHLGTQNGIYAERLLALGAAPKSVTVTGSIKFDRIETNPENPRTKELREAFGLQAGDPVFIAGSTQAPEEQFALDAWQTARKAHPDLRLILVPRHKERFEDVASLITKRGLPLIRRSASSNEMPSGDDTTQLPPVLLLDTLGELGACWGLADIAFVGGSLTSRGGQNMIEPAAYGAAVLFGPNTWNFRDVVDLLLTGQAACVVADADALTKRIGVLLDDPAVAREQGQIAQRLVLAQQGATERTVDLILETLPVAPHMPRRKAA